MNSIVEIGNKQYNIKKGDIITVDKIDKEVNQKIEFDNVLSVNKDKNITVGDPYVKNAKVNAKILEHVRDKKVNVFKFKRRKNYKRLKGHKQPYTIIKIEDIKVS